jgi:hypothetical protein
MEVQLEDPVQEIERLQRCISDLMSLLVLPAIWRGTEPSQIVQTLLDVLLRMLSLDFAYARLSDAFGAMPVEILRVAEDSKINLSAQKVQQYARRPTSCLRSRVSPANKEPISSRRHCDRPRAVGRTW